MDKELALNFLKEIFEKVPGDQWISIFAIDRTVEPSARASQKILWNRVDELEELVDRLEPLSATHCIWYGIATRRARLEKGRGGAEDCALIPALWLDLDIAGPGHKTAENLPPTMEDTLKLLDEYNPPTDFIVSTGGGVQPYWLLDEPVPVSIVLPDLDNWYYTWQKILKEHGWHLDNVFDPARILRVPGTFNRKTSNAIPVTIIYPVTII